MNFLQGLFYSFIQYLPNLLLGIVLIVVAWIVATIIRRLVNKGLQALKFDQRLVKWDAAKNEQEGQKTIASIGSVFYYLVWVLFLPGIFTTFNLESIATPIRNMIDTALTFIPSLIAAIVIIVVGVIAARFVKNLVFNLANSVDVDGWVNKFISSDASTYKKENQAVIEADKTPSDDETIASLLGNLVYFIVLIPILVVALETLGIESITRPVVNVLNSILNAIPNILVAVILLAVGFALAKVVANVIESLLEGAGANRLTNYINDDRANKLNLSKIIGNIVGAFIVLLFVVESLNVLNLSILNTVGSAIIAYLPNILFAVIILGIGMIGGQYLAKFVRETSNSRWLGEVVKYLVITLAIFMTLEQLNFATSIVNTAFLFIIGGISLAFALSFGLGGRDFAKGQLDRLDDKMTEETKKSDQVDSKNQQL